MGGYQPYPEYQPTEIEWLGVIPCQWVMTRVKYIGDIIIGLTYSPNDVVSENEGLLVLRSSNVQNAKISLEDNVYVNVQVKAKLLVRSGDILVCARNGSRHLIGKSAIIENDLIGCTFGAFMTILRSKHSKFLYYILNSALFTFQSSRFLTSTINQLTTETLGGFEIPLPPKDEQLKIGKFLDYKTAQIDALIAKKETLLTKLAEKRTALISHAVTKGLDYSVPMKDSEVEWLGDIPAHWNTKRLKFTILIFGGGTPNTSNPEFWNGEIPWVSPKDMKSDLIESTEDYLTELGVKESATKVIPKDAVLIVVRSGILRHTIPVARNVVEVTLNQDMKALIANDWLRSDFLHYFISGLQDGLLPLWSKQGCTVESIEMDYMRNSPIPLPPVEEQEVIVNHIVTVVGKIELQASKIGAAINTLKEYRSSLITNAVTGKIDVRDFKIPATAEATVGGI